ncbi:MAG: BatD family protein [bacterium]|nr:BatD family protein [bacterium]
MRAGSRLVAALIAAAVAGDAGAAEIAAWASARTVALGERLVFSVRVSGAERSGAPSLPDLDGFRLADTAHSTQIQIANGVSSVSAQYDYTLVPLRTGRLTIGPVQVAYGGGTLATAPVTVEVVETADRAARAAADAAAPERAARENMFVELLADKEEAYLHEQVTLTFRFHLSGVSLAEQPSYEPPPAGGFVEKPLGAGGSANYARVIGGRRYQVSEIQTALFPYRTGELAIGPARLSGALLEEAPRRRTGSRGFFDIDDFFSDPFFGRFTRRPFTLLSNEVKVRVRPLPAEGAPAGEAAVGRYAMEVEARPREVRVGDPVTVTMVVRGEGDLDRVPPPRIERLDGFKSYDVTSRTEMTGRSGVIEGVKTFEQVLVPLDPAIREVPPAVFDSFDPRRGAYASLRAGPIPLTVLPAEDGDAAKLVSLPAAFEGRRVELLERNIVFIKTDPGDLAREPGRPSAVFWILQCVPLALVLAALAHARHGERLRSDRRYARLHGAGRMTRRRLAAARAALGQGDVGGFYGGLARAVTMYVADRIGIPTGGLTPEIVRERLRERGIPAALLDRVDRFLLSCERARFSPGAGGAGETEAAAGEAAAVIGELRRSGL